MKYISGPLRRFAPRAITFSLAGALLYAPAFVGCSGPPGTQSTSASVQSLFTPEQVLPQRCQYGSCYFYKLVIVPRKRTLKLNQKINLHDEFKSCSWRRHGHPECHSVGMVPAAWSSSGGSLKVKYGDMKAVFSALSPGVYTVVAKYVFEGWHTEGQAIMTVTSP